jgi:Arc/MetJ-type ribon-helix-helix transcriptional regulator
MTVEKVAVSLPPELLRRARLEVAAGRAPSLSAFVADALAAQLRTDSLDRLLADLDAEHGPVSKETIAWAEAEFDRAERELE